MIAIKFSEFYKGDYEDHGYELYIIKDSDEKAMYIGISRDPIWHRWFSGGTSHMYINPAGKLYGKSNIGEIIERRLPISWDWIIELWSKEDCLNILGNSFDEKHKTVPIELIEPYMIIKFEPLYNVMHNDGHHEDPLVSKKLDIIYRRLFG